MIQPYLYFNGKCEEAIQFYQTALGAEVEMMMRFSESPDPMPPGMVPEGFEKKIMHATLKIGESIVMASDGSSDQPAHFSNFALSIRTKDEAESERNFNALAEGGSIQMPLGKTFWSQNFGMVTDRYGVPWIINMDS